MAVTGLAPEHRLLLDALPHYNGITESTLPQVISNYGEERTELECMLHLLTTHSDMRADTLAAARQRLATTLRSAAHLVREAQRIELGSHYWMIDAAELQQIANRLGQLATDMEPPVPPQRRVGNPGSPEFRAFVGIAAIFYEREIGQPPTPRSTRFVRWIEPYLTLGAAHAYGWPRTDQQRAERIRAALAKSPPGPGDITNVPNKPR